jgi:hypothetical protein
MYQSGVPELVDSSSKFTKLPRGNIYSPNVMVWNPYSTAVKPYNTATARSPIVGSLPSSEPPQ